MSGKVSPVLLKYVVKVSSPEVVNTKDGKELQKQDCFSGDVSGSVCVILWEKDVGALSEGCSYRLVDVSVRVFSNVKYLSVAEE